ncbi:MAG: AraC family ligand binding domain-containing protein, partial [Oscillospiraceae bacterium]|nr:AraC family ligand binding domain-containing protein [Oscillospiraceae bacterium]
MDRAKSVSREGYLRENYHYFHLRDTAGQERDFHFHDFDKLVLLLAGRVDYVVENQRVSLRPGTVLLVKHHAIHKAIIDKTVPYERIILYLDRGFFDRSLPEIRLLDCFETADRTGRYLLEPDGEQMRELRQT